MVVTGKCSGCGKKLGLAYISGLTKPVVDIAEGFLGDPDMRLYCPICKDFMEVEDMKQAKYEKNEVKRRMEEGEVEELFPE